MRKLKTKDVPAFCRLLKAIGAKEEIKRICEEANSARDAFGAGFELIYTLIELATESKAEGLVYEFLSGILEMPAEDIGDLDLPDFAGFMKQLAAENDLSGFFGSALDTMK